MKDIMFRKIDGKIYMRSVKAKNKEFAIGYVEQYKKDGYQAKYKLSEHGYIVYVRFPEIMKHYKEWQENRKREKKVMDIFK